MSASRAEILAAARVAEIAAPLVVRRAVAILAERDAGPDPLLDTAGAAAYMGVDEATVRRWARSGRIPVLRLGDGPRARFRFDAAALREALASDGNGTR